MSVWTRGNIWQQHPSKRVSNMCFDIGIEVCGPNEALVISGLFYVSHRELVIWSLMSFIAGGPPQVHCGRPGAGVPVRADHPEAAPQHHDARGQDHQGLHSPGRYFLQYIYRIYNISTYLLRQGVPLTVVGVAQVKINGADEDMLSYAAEQFGGGKNFRDC